ncbi:DCC1-like thiol-disulfide oxidoreductase family protein [Flavobacterium sp. ZB4R12]|uniref:DCC1-like thiol-disulfide oxidoreductase family protein n=1 Tax=Flavobacterium sp. ZB4R12 TaxID=3398732 RepID=UPI003AB0D3F5
MTILTVFYDDWCPNCSKFVNLIHKLDWLNLIETKRLRNELDTNSFRSLDFKLAKQQMASFDTSWHFGYNSLYFIFIRLPLFYIFLPLLFILKITGFGQYLYIQLAINRKIVPLQCNSETCETK